MGRRAANQERKGHSFSLQAWNPVGFPWKSVNVPRVSLPKGHALDRRCHQPLRVSCGVLSVATCSSELVCAEGEADWDSETDAPALAGTGATDSDAVVGR